MSNNENSSNYWKDLYEEMAEYAGGLFRERNALEKRVKGLESIVNLAKRDSDGLNKDLLSLAKDLTDLAEGKGLDRSCNCDDYYHDDY